MSLNTFWSRRKPAKRVKPLAWGDTFHSYITAYRVYRDDDDPNGYSHQVVFGELKLCENINIRRAPIPTSAVEQVKYRAPYARCEKCTRDVEWLLKMQFGQIIEMRDSEEYIRL